MLAQKVTRYIWSKKCLNRVWDRKLLRQTNPRTRSTTDGEMLPLCRSRVKDDGKRQQPIMADKLR